MTSSHLHFQADTADPSTIPLSTSNIPSQLQETPSASAQLAGPEPKQQKQQQHARLNDMGKNILDNWLDCHITSKNDSANIPREAKHTAIKQVQDAGNEWFQNVNLGYYIKKKAASLPDPVFATAPSKVAAWINEEASLFGRIAIEKRQELRWYFKENMAKEHSLPYLSYKVGLRIEDTQAYVAFLHNMGQDLYDFPDIPEKIKVNIQDLLRGHPDIDHHAIRNWAAMVGIDSLDMKTYVLHLQAIGDGEGTRSHLPTPVSLSPGPSLSISSAASSCIVSASSASSYVKQEAPASLDILFHHPLNAIDGRIDRIKSALAATDAGTVSATSSKRSRTSTPQTARLPAFAEQDEVKQLGHSQIQTHVLSRSNPQGNSAALEHHDGEVAIAKHSTDRLTLTPHLATAQPAAADRLPGTVERAGNGTGASQGDTGVDVRTKTRPTFVRDDFSSRSGSARIHVNAPQVCADETTAPDNESRRSCAPLRSSEGTETLMPTLEKSDAMDVDNGTDSSEEEGELAYPVTENDDIDDIEIELAPCTATPTQGSASNAANLQADELQDEQVPDNIQSFLEWFEQYNKPIDDLLALGERLATAVEQA
ncbi:hypothetical protein DFH11DRAFT_1588437 [Phellopilus nigrolimitatus]|nr:hypothetical protein DFH11DRAFT_1588437 [Phellopilus nigrolimitatus]